MQKSLPCPGCGYDLRATPKDGWHITCPECGTRWPVSQVEAFAEQPYLTVGKLMAWVFAMPVLYAVLNLGTCFCFCSAAVSMSESLSGLSAWATFIVYLVVYLGLIALGNRGIAGRWACRMTQTPVYGGLRSGGWYWCTLIVITAVQGICAWGYPLLLLWMIALPF
ncbi:MAG: hypothetical protein AAF593_03775 [Planctomycetota bacterium]